MKRLKNLIELLAKNHRGLGHREYEPHFAYWNDDKDMKLPAEMHFPFVLFGHGGCMILPGEDKRRWQVLLSVQTHVADTGDERERNRAFGKCLDILEDLLSRWTSPKMKMEPSYSFCRGISLANSTISQIENADMSLYGWAIDFTIVLPWCKEFDERKWEDADALNEF